MLPPSRIPAPGPAQGCAAWGPREFRRPITPHRAAAQRIELPRDDSGRGRHTRLAARLAVPGRRGPDVPGPRPGQPVAAGVPSLAGEEGRSGRAARDCAPPADVWTPGRLPVLPGGCPVRAAETVWPRWWGPYPGRYRACLLPGPASVAGRTTPGWRGRGMAELAVRSWQGGKRRVRAGRPGTGRRGDRTTRSRWRRSGRKHPISASAR